MSFSTIYAALREAFPPARVVAFLVPLAAPFIAAISTFVLNELPFIAEYVNGEWLAGVWAVSVAAIVGLAYKWLDGRAKYETAVVAAVADPDDAFVLSQGSDELDPEDLYDEPQTLKRK